MTPLRSGSGSCSGERSLTRIPAASASGPGGIKAHIARVYHAAGRGQAERAAIFHKGAQVFGDLVIDAEQAGGKDQAIAPIINRAYRPTDNDVVERNHWTWELHVLLEQVYQNETEVQQATDQDFADRRDELPSRHSGCQGRPFAVAYPMLKEKRRPYTIAEETTYFDLQRVDDYLSQWEREWKRNVDSAGKISLADQTFTVGRKYRWQVVKIHFEIQTRQFVCQHVEDHELARWTIDKVSQDYILGTEHNVF